jgi:hypothetical protein
MKVRFGGNIMRWNDHLTHCRPRARVRQVAQFSGR